MFHVLMIHIWVYGMSDNFRVKNAMDIMTQIIICGMLK